jgi:hypothetical protein
VKFSLGISLGLDFTLHNMAKGLFGRAVTDSVSVRSDSLREVILWLEVVLK